MKKYTFIVKMGGEGSGNWGHEGRPGEIGGSGEGGINTDILREGIRSGKYKNEKEFIKNNFEKLYGKTKEGEKRLYHVIGKGEENTIKKEGLKGSLSEKISVDKRLNKKGVYGFDNIGDAQDFAYENGFEDNYSIAIFDIPSYKIIKDTEYIEGSFFFKGDISPNEIKGISEYEKIEENKKILKDFYNKIKEGK